MDHTIAVTKSIEYTREALIGKWARWIIFVILGFPMALLPFVLNVNTIGATDSFSWEQIPWDQIGVIVLAGIILSFFLSGYIFRIYRGVQPAPDFNDWGALFIDGLKLQVTSFIWMLPIMIIIIAGFVGLSFVTMGSAGTASAGLLLVLLAALFIAMIFFIIVALFIPMALVRFARTGSMREGLRVSEILAHIGRIGWGQYIIAIIVLVAVMLLFGFLVTIFSLIPLIGWLLELAVTPFLTIFGARYYTLVYEEGTVPPVSA